MKNIIKQLDRLKYENAKLLNINANLNNKVANLIEENNRLADFHTHFIPVLDGIDAFVIVTSIDSHEILFSNKKAREFFGQHLIGRRCWDAIRRKDGPCQDCVIPNLVSGNNGNEQTIIHETFNSISQKWFLNSETLIPWSENTRALLSVGVDITEIKNSQEEKKLLNEQLNHAQKMEAIGILAGGIAHDFNNILGAIIGYSELIEMTSNVGSETHQYILEILTASNRAKELVKQILAFSRKGKTVRIPLNPGAPVKEVVKLLRASLPSTIEIVHDIDIHAGCILADANHLHQILMNLSTNAFHAMEEKGGTLYISQRRREGMFSPNVGEENQSTRFIQITVRDTGKGIDPEIIDKIFTPFFTTKEIGKGTGMGLSIVHGLVQENEGYILCESQLNIGTEFQILLPLVEENESAKKKISDEPLPLGTEHILLVDDEKLLLNANSATLTKLGYKVTAILSSTEALDTFTQNPEEFDLIITDQTMPGMTGIDLAQQILKVKPEIPIILCTGFSAVISAQKATLLGIKGFVTKPLRQRDFAEIVRKSLDDSSSQLITL